MVKHVSLLVLRTSPYWNVVAEHLPDGRAQALGPVDHEQQPLLDVQAPVDQIGQQRAGHGGVLGRAVPHAQRELLTLCRDPQRDNAGAAVSSIPSSMITARRRSASGRFINFNNRSRVRCTNVRDTADLDVDRAFASTCSPTGSCARPYRRVDTPASIRSSTTPSS
jgi:hypothetical protein